MEKTTKKQPSVYFPKLSGDLQKEVNFLMTLRMKDIQDFASQPSDDQLNYVATLTDLASQLRTAVILAERLIYFHNKLQ